jgi:deoxyribodipyrimidine photolyase-related protein
MGPNVFGMGQFSDGGLFATKPYISGSNYIRKMSHYPKGQWCDIVDGLYWLFIDRRKSFFKKQYRMSMMISALDKMDEQKKQRIFAAAKSFIKDKTK